LFLLREGRGFYYFSDKESTGIVFMWPRSHERMIIFSVEQGYREVISIIVCKLVEYFFVFKPVESTGRVYEFSSDFCGN
jgi:hypothetical protein